MYKILIVDDEVLVRVGIKSMFNWEEKGYTIIGEAANGVEALSKIEEYKPDIIFVDLMMKKMDGFELIKAVKKDYPKIKIIVLSCYNDFKNVKEAMRLGASDYIFKLSITSEEILSTLDGIKNQIDEDVKKYNSKDIYENMVNENISTLKEKKLKTAVEQSFSSEDEFYNELATLDMKINLKQAYFVLVIKIDNIYDLDLNSKIKEKDILNSAIINMISEALQKLINFEVFSYNEGEIISVINCEHYENIKEDIIDVFTKIKDYLDRYLGISISGGVSSIHKGLKQFKTTVQEGEKACNLRFYRGIGNCFNYIENMDNNIFKDMELPNFIEYSNFIRESIEKTDCKLCKQYINEYILKLKSKESLSESKIRNQIQQLLFFIGSIAKGRGIDIYMMKVENYNLESDEIISKYISIDEIIVWINNFIDKFFESIQKNMYGKYREEIIKIQYYVRDNLDKIIDIPTAAAYVNMSESYFSHIFKKEVGIGFIDYVNNEKIQKAKELIISSNYKVYEVSDMLGFQNSTYFTILFKKVTGLSPLDYKKSIKV